MLTGVRGTPDEQRARQPAEVPEQLWSLVQDLTAADPDARPSSARTALGRLGPGPAEWDPSALGDVEVFTHVGPDSEGRPQLVARPPGPPPAHAPSLLPPHPVVVGSSGSGIPFPRSSRRRASGRPRRRRCGRNPRRPAAGRPPSLPRSRSWRCSASGRCSSPGRRGRRARLLPVHRRQRVRPARPRRRSPRRARRRPRRRARRPRPRRHPPRRARSRSEPWWPPSASRASSARSASRSGPWVGRRWLASAAPTAATPGTHRPADRRPADRRPAGRRRPSPAAGARERRPGCPRRRAGRRPRSPRSPSSAGARWSTRRRR